MPRKIPPQTAAGKLYAAMLEAAADQTSELYYNGLPHRGAGHRTAFWDGYAGMTRSANAIPWTLSWTCYRTGQAFAKTNPGICFEDAVWTPGVTRQSRET